MQQREGFPAGVPAWVDRTVTDPSALSRFYAELFGWELAAASDSDRYLVASLDGRRAAAFASPRDAVPVSSAWTTYIACVDAAATARLVREAGGTVHAQPHVIRDVATVALCSDADGATFGLWEPGAILGAEVVNVPGAWNFSELNVSDVDRASAFYGAVFGWEVSEVDMGGWKATMIRLPGYADFLEQYDPGIRQRHADFGAPPGFSECVAWIVPLADDASPHWTITFTVDDPDAIASRARALGGSVVTKPYDIGPVRSAVIRDPDGATFAANSFDPG